MSVLKYDFKQYLVALRILHLALVAAVVVFGAVVHFVLLPLPDFQPNQNSVLFVNLSAVYLVFAATIGYWLFGNQLKTAKKLKTLNDKLNAYRSASIVRFALLEGAALVAIVFYLLTGNIVLLGIAGIGLLVLLLAHPNPTKLKDHLDLSQAELARLEDPTKQVASSTLMKRF